MLYNCAYSKYIKKYRRFGLELNSCLMQEKQNENNKLKNRGCPPEWSSMVSKQKRIID